MTPQDDHGTTCTYRGRSLEELVPAHPRRAGRRRGHRGAPRDDQRRRRRLLRQREIEVEVRAGAAGRAAPARSSPRRSPEQLAEAQDAAAGRRSARAARAPPAEPAPAPPRGRPRSTRCPAATDVTVDDLFPPPAAAAGPGWRALSSSRRRAAGPGARARHDGARAASRAGASPSPSPAARARARAAAPSPPSPSPSRAPSRAGRPSSARSPLPLAARGAAERLVARGLRPGLAEAVAEEAVASLLPLAPDADPTALVLDALARRIPDRTPCAAGRRRRRLRRPRRRRQDAAASRAWRPPTRATARCRSPSLALRSPDGGAELTRLLAPYGVALHAVEGGAEGAARIAALRGAASSSSTRRASARARPASCARSAAELRTLAPDELHLTVLGHDRARCGARARARRPRARRRRARRHPHRRDRAARHRSSGWRSTPACPCPTSPAASGRGGPAPGVRPASWPRALLP